MPTLMTDLAVTSMNITDTLNVKKVSQYWLTLLDKMADMCMTN